MSELLPVAGHPSPPGARLLGAAVLGFAGAAAAALLLRSRRGGRVEEAKQPTRGLRAGAALLAASVLADSSVEHYRGAFENEGMAAPLVIAGAVMLVDGTGARSGRTGDAVHLAAVAVGAAGTAFHVYNVGRRPGGYRWLNLFYAAPLGAPAALSLAGLLGLAAERVEGGSPSLLGLPAGRALAGLIGAGLAGTSVEVWLLHFRGAFHHPAMYLPVTMPPVAAALLGRAALGPADAKTMTRAWLAATALMGMAGVAFHARGVGRQMGGWRNWTQNLLDGPPIPAPPSFAALALAGLSALQLIGDERG